MVAIKRFNDITGRIFDLHKNGNKQGVSTGFKTLDPYYTVRQSNTTIIYGRPTAGKTQFLFQLLVSLTSQFGYRHLVYSPESGSAEDIYAELIHCFTGKTFDKRFTNYISEAEIYSVQPFLQEYFTILDPSDERGVEFQEYIDIVKECKKDYKIDTSSIDNWNDIEHRLSDGGGLISEYLKQTLPKWNRLAKSLNIHNFMVAHARNPTIVAGEQVPKAPRPDEIEGGSVWYAKAQNLICVDRDYEEINGSFQQSRTVTIDVKKVKPKIVGNKGAIKLEFDIRKNAYSEVINGINTYIKTPFSQEPEPFNPTPHKVEGGGISVSKKIDMFESEEVPF